MADAIIYLGHASGEYNGHSYTSLYLCEKMRKGYGFVAYRKSYRGNRDDLTGLQPGEPIAPSYDRFGNISAVEPAFDD